MPNAIPIWRKCHLRKHSRTCAVCVLCGVHERARDGRERHTNKHNKKGG